MFKHIQDASFNAFVRFAYYTGARSGEVRNLNQNCILKYSIVVYGKLVKDTLSLTHKHFYYSKIRKSYGIIEKISSVTILS